MGRWVGGWMDAWRKLVGGGSLGHKCLGSDCLRSPPAKVLEFGVPVGGADPRDLGYDRTCPVTRQLMVGNFRRPPPPPPPDCGRTLGAT